MSYKISKYVYQTYELWNTTFFFEIVLVGLNL